MSFWDWSSATSPFDKRPRRLGLPGAIRTSTTGWFKFGWSQAGSTGVRIHHWLSASVWESGHHVSLTRSQVRRHAKTTWLTAQGASGWPMRYDRFLSQGSEWISTKALRSAGSRQDRVLLGAKHGYGYTSSSMRQGYATVVLKCQRCSWFFLQSSL